MNIFKEMRKPPQKVEHVFIVTNPNGLETEVVAGDTNIDRSGNLVFYDVWWSFMQTFRRDFLTIAAGEWTKVSRKKD